MSFSRFKLTKTALSAVAAAISVTCYAQDTRTGNIVNSPVVKGKTTVVTVDAQVDASLRRQAGSAGGADIMDGSVNVNNTRTGDITNAPRHEGDLTIVTSGPATLRSVSVTGGARTGNLTNATQRNGNLLLVAGGVEGSRAGLSASAGTTGSATVDAIRVCGGRTGNVTNAGKVNGDATYVGRNVAVNSVSVGCP